MFQGDGNGRVPMQVQLTPFAHDANQWRGRFRGEKFVTDVDYLAGKARN